ncbi:hypothetical protein PQE66_gp072 [Bacillus phage PBC2]|uniref:Uncharacterized protein n=1 Tax=Bacillus phage PBC2 TaxID=1675029 RepID=A0A218KBW8_9CAUD|nr:hypothetical protein PQE66_gp072 [Bacillus phage PBC2]AKQ08387.1 hypothetical protein PBC2_072 [Bacillus phage PBC2]
MENKELKEYSGMRKHGSQLERLEEIGLWKRLKSVQEWEWNLIDHALDRIEQKGIEATRNDIISTISHSSIIEYRIVYNHEHEIYEERVVLRSKAIVNKHHNIHAVFSLTLNNIVTVWMNDFHDRHATLDWGLYNKNMKVFGV